MEELQAQMDSLVAEKKVLEVEKEALQKKIAAAADSLSVIEQHFTELAKKNEIILQQEEFAAAS
jgi:regulator of replication initiation timing